MLAGTQASESDDLSARQLRSPKDLLKGRDYVSFESFKIIMIVAYPLDRCSLSCQSLLMIWIQIAPINRISIE